MCLSWRRTAYPALAALFAFALTACGGGDDEPPGLPVPAVRAATVPQPPAAAGASLTPDALFSWAESQFPVLFPAAGQPTLTAGPYTYRYYPATGNHLGVAGEDVFVMGPITLGMVARVGSLSDFSCEAARIGCRAPGAPIITSLERGNGTATAYIAPPPDTGSGPVTGYAVTCVGPGSIRSASGTEATLVLTGLSPGAEYTCMAAASNAYGMSAASPSVILAMPSAASYQQTKVKLTSDLGDYVGGGRSYEYTNASARLAATADGPHFTLSVRGDEWWRFDVVLPAGMTRLTAGTYTGLTRYPFAGSNGGLDWSGEGRGCNVLTGSVTVHSVGYMGDQLDALNLSFVQHCENESSALRGTIVWGANDSTLPPGPATPIPGALWKPAAGAVPATGNYVYTESDPADYIGQGVTSIYTGAQITHLGLAGNLLRISVNGGGSLNYFSGNFIGMSSLAALQVGYYGTLIRYPFHNPMKGGLDWSGSGRGCNTLSGWFAIDELVMDGGTLRHIVMRFEQHCEGHPAALRGQVRWTAP